MRLMRILLGTAIVMIAIAQAGCESGLPAPAPKRDASGAEVPVTLKEVNYSEFDEFVRSKKGSVVLVDVWATWCGPCRQSFPHIVELNNKYSDLGLECVSLSLDGQNDRGTAADALKFLKARKAAFTNFVWKEPTEQEDREFTSRYHFQGEIPHTVIFGRSGRLVWNSSEDSGAIDTVVRAELDKK